MSNTIAQERSAFALNEVKKLGQNPKEFGKLVAGLPAMILQNGFGQSLAFLLSKGTDKHGRFEESNKHLKAFDIIARWLVKRKMLPNDDREKVVITLSGLPQVDYLQAQEEALRVLEWVKRYANAGLFS